MKKWLRWKTKATIIMGSNMWMEVINSENPPIKPVDIRISNDIYWALASA